MVGYVGCGVLTPSQCTQIVCLLESFSHDKILCQFPMGLESYICPCVRRHLLGPYKNTNRLQRKQSSLCDIFHAIGYLSLLHRMIADAIGLCFSAQLVNRGVIILVSFDVRIVCREG